ncbi:MAG: integrase/recombinase XerD [Patiriisocius sp.]|jgi:integrase/recombinase XerD
MRSIEDFVRILELKRYSRNTINSYQSHLRLAHGYFNHRDFKQIKDKELFAFIYHMVSIKKISSSYQRQIVGAFKLFYKEMYARSIPFEYLKIQRHEQKLPVVIGKDEVLRIINVLDNLKHKALIALLYGSGLRIGELLELKKSDIDSDRMAVHVKAGKGKKDRYTILSNAALEILREYYLKFRPKEFLFEGHKGGKYSSASAAQLFKRSLAKAKIGKHATLHTLRHSFATHLLEDGVGVGHIQKLLGHSNIKTTLIYTQIAQDSLLRIKSPLDVI